jgi:hypothetical protein
MIGGTMISPKEAANAAIGYFQQLVDIHLESVMLEEIELSEDGRTWEVTIGYTFQDFRNLGIPISRARHYKSFKIDASTGAIKSMKIRKLE